MCSSDLSPDFAALHPGYGSGWRRMGYLPGGVEFNSPVPVESGCNELDSGEWPLQARMTPGGGAVDHGGRDGDDEDFHGGEPGVLDLVLWGRQRKEAHCQDHGIGHAEKRDGAGRDDCEARRYRHFEADVTTQHALGSTWQAGPPSRRAGGS